MCKNCLNSIKYIKKVYCNRCGSPYLEKCLCNNLHYSIEQVRSLFLFDGVGKELIHKWKFGVGYYYIKDLFERMIINYFPYKNIEFDGLIYVPTYFIKKIYRGFNQAEELGKFLIKKYNFNDYSNFLKKRYRKKSQSKCKNYAQRVENIKNSFKLKASIKGEKFLLIDDIFTSGSTMNEVCKVVSRDNPNIKFYIYTLAMAV